MSWRKSMSPTAHLEEAPLLYSLYRKGRNKQKVLCWLVFHAAFLIV